MMRDMKGWEVEMKMSAKTCYRAQADIGER